ncbi:hypothetical protein PV325_005544, partial [Microctonus aethiopoides]
MDYGSEMDGRSIKYLLFFVKFVTYIVGCAVNGLGVWALVYIVSYVSEIIEINLLPGAAYVFLGHGKIVDNRKFIALTKKIIMGSIAAKRRKMGDHEINEPTQTSHTTEIGKPDTSFSCYDYHYNQPFYADKTLLIKELIQYHHVLVTAPSRFGKTLNMDM